MELLTTIGKSLVTGVVTIALSIGSLFGYGGGIATQNDLQEVKIAVEDAILTEELDLGAAPKFIAGATYNLAGSGLSSSATSFTLQSFTIKQTGQEIQDSDMGDSFYITIEPGSPTRQEVVKCTTVAQSSSNDTATISGCTRGISPVSPYSASTTLAFVHGGGSQVIFSDPPGVYQSIIDYIDAAAIAGAVDSSLTVKGIVEVASGLEAASSTAIGSGNTSAPLVLTSEISTSTYNSATAALKVVVTQNSGKIDSAFVATSTLYGGAGSGLATTTGIGSFPAWHIGKQRQVITTTGTSTFSVPSGVTKISVITVAGGGAGGDGANGSPDYGGGGGGAGGTAIENIDVTGTSTIQVFVGTAGQPSKFGTNGFYHSATAGTAGTAGSGATSVTAGGTGGIGSGGDINLAGQDGANAHSGSAGGAGATGGTSFLGGGGRGGTQDGNGVSSSGYGGGGGGGSGSGTSGTGAQGVIIIEW